MDKALPRRSLRTRLPSSDPAPSKVCRLVAPKASSLGIRAINQNLELIETPVKQRHRRLVMDTCSSPVEVVQTYMLTVHTRLSILNVWSDCQIRHYHAATTNDTAGTVCQVMTQQLQLVQSLAGSLKNSCDPTCSCHQLPPALVNCAWAAAADGEGGSPVCAQFLQLLPQLAAALSGPDWKLCKGHNHGARHATLDSYNR